LIGEEEVGAGGRGQELKRAQRRRDAPLAQGHPFGKDHAAVGHDVLIAGVVGAGDAVKRGVRSQEDADAFLAVYAKVQLVVLNGVAAAIDKPSALLSRVGKGGEDALGRKWVAALEGKGGVDDGWFGHEFSSKRGIDKVTT